MTTEQKFERDQIVFQRCKGRDLPVHFVLAGDYNHAGLLLSLGLAV